MRYRFATFELDTRTGELRRRGLLVRLHAQSAEVLQLLLQTPGEMVSREQIARALWPEGTFVDFEHGVNSAVNRLREALGDRAKHPRFVETVARRGYRLLVPVELVEPGQDSPRQLRAAGSSMDQPAAAAQAACDHAPEPAAEPHHSCSHELVIPVWQRRLLARPDDLPLAPPALVRVLFLLLQGMYLAFYIAALANLGEIGEVLTADFGAGGVWLGSIATLAALLIPVRLFLLCAELFQAPRFAHQFLRIWPFLLVMDTAWSLAPLLMLHHLPFGLALAAMAFLVYAPFAQRSLVLMRAAARASGCAHVGKTGQ